MCQNQYDARGSSVRRRWEKTWRWFVRRDTLLCIETLNVRISVTASGKGIFWYRTLVFKMAHIIASWSLAHLLWNNLLTLPHFLLCNILILSSTCASLQATSSFQVTQLTKNVCIWPLPLGGGGTHTPPAPLTQILFVKSSRYEVPYYKHNKTTSADVRSDTVARQRRNTAAFTPPPPGHAALRSSVQWQPAMQRHGQWVRTLITVPNKNYSKSLVR
jgi:hypothetical protein